MPNLWPILIAFVLFFVGVPVAFSMIIASLIYFTFWCDGVTLFNMISALFEQSSSFTMMAVPFFILAGSVMGYGGVSESLMDFCGMLTSKFTGGLGATNCLLSTFMGGLSGSSCADAAFEARMLCPEMVKRGYPLGYSAALTATTSCITPIIPPGIALIIYATAASCSIGDMFLAGYIPGIIMCVALLVVNYFIAKTRGYQPAVKEKVTAKQFMKQLGSSIWALLMPIGIVMGMRVGIFTPTECAAICVLYSLFCGVFIYRRLKLEHIKKIVVESVHSTASVLLILSAASMFSRYMLWENIPQIGTNLLIKIAPNGTVFILIVLVFMLIMGMFLDTAAALVILPPLLIPVAKTLGVDVIHLGLVMVLMDTLGGVTPPFGVMMFSVMGVTKVKMSEYMKDGWPLILTLLIVCAFVAVCPVDMILLNLFR